MHTPATSTSAPRTLARVYPGTTKHIRAVRSDLRDLLADCPAADVVILCASELATNAVRHSRSGLPDRTFMIHVTVLPGTCVRIEVQDDGGLWAPVLGDTARHHGFDIVGRLAANWAVEGDDSGRRVSAFLNWTPLPE
jgi:serine/threonine-protein kinase RsbW